MRLKHKLFNVFASIVMVFGSVPMAFMNAYAEGESAGEAPRSLKTVRANLNEDGVPDGTYDITLEIEGVSSQKNDATKANVVVILDTSGSMNRAESTYEYETNNTGRYGLSNGDYLNLYRLNSRRRCVEVENDSTTGTVYLNAANCRNNTPYTGTRYSRVESSLGTRIQVAKDAVNVLANQLLSQNDATKPGFEDVVEMTFVDFATSVNATEGPTTDLDTFKGWITNAEVQTGNAAGTNWEAALTTANGITFGEDDTDKIYIIFVSDGNPTFRDSKYDSRATDCVSSHFDYSSWSYVCDNDTIWGSGSDDPNSWNLNAAVDVANLITTEDSNKELYAVGAFGDATNMQSLGGTYYDATNQDALEEAFSDIVDKITMGLTVSDLQITDGITTATSTEVNGTAGHFRYNVPESWGDDYEKASFANGAVTWNPGHDKTLSNGEKASVTFTVWPSQEAMDCIASIKNDGVCNIENLEEYGLAQKEDGGYMLLTNTSATFRYRTATTIEGSDEPTYSELSSPVEMRESRDDTTLPENELEVTKLWADGMDPGQREDIKEITLKLKVDDTEVRTFVFNKQGAGENEWKNSYTYAVAPGVMKKLDGTAETEGLRAIAEKIVTVGDAEYAVLELGHDYLFDESYTLTEDGGTNHYHITKRLYHPMIVDDGKIHDVVFSEDGTTAEITSIELSKLSAENTLNGGILVGKKVINNGAEDTTITDKYPITITMTGSDSGKYRIYTYNSDGTVASRTDKLDYTGGVINAEIQVNQKIMVTDVPTGTTYVVTETLPEGYTRNEVNYLLIKYDGTDNEEGVQEVFGNTSATATVTNYLESGNLVITKTVTASSGNLTQARTQEFDFTVNFYKNQGDTTAVKTETFTLSHGETKTIKNIPIGWYYEIVETGKPGFNGGMATTKTGTISTGSKTEAFTNNYAVSKLNDNDAKIIATKGFESGFERFWLGTDEFIFVLSGNGKVVESDPVTLTFNTAEFIADIADAGTFTYTITEKTTDSETGASLFRDGVLRLDGDEDITVTIVTRDKGDGTLELVSKTYSKESKTIYNTYRASGTLGEGETDGILEFNKVLTGRDWKDSDLFTFTISSADGKLPEVVTKTARKGQTTFDFGTITYTAEDAGHTYNYTVTETFDTTVMNSVEPAEEVAGGISFNVTVTDNEDGTLDLTVSEFNHTFTNVYKTVSVSASKVWSDDDNRDDLRKNYSNYYMAVKDAAGKFVAYQQLALTNQDYTFTNLPEKGADGTVISYTVVEASSCTGTGDAISCTEFTGDSSYAVTSSDGVITNTHQPGKVHLTIKKIWDVSAGSLPSIAPGVVTVEVSNDKNSEVKTVVLNGSSYGEWTGDFEGNEYENGAKINYTVREMKIGDSGLDSSNTLYIYNGEALEGKWLASNSGVTVTNTWTPATESIETSSGDGKFTIVKIDGNNQAMSGVTFTINGKDSETNGEGKIEVTVPVSTTTKDDSFEYTVSEKATREGYDLVGGSAVVAVTCSSALSNANKSTLVNTYTKTCTFSKSGKEEFVWDGTNKTLTITNQRSMAKSFVIKKTFLGVSAEVLSDLTFTVSGPADFGTDGELELVFGKDCSVSSGVATCSISELIPTGVYTVTESGADVEHFTLVPSGAGEEVTVESGAQIIYEIENKYEVDKTTFSVAKVWDDDSDRDDLRPDDLNVDLLADGAKVGSAKLEGDSWSYTWSGLPVADENAKVIEYSVAEGTVGEYTLVSAEMVDGVFTLTNKHAPALINDEDDDPDNDGKLKVVKEWDDENNLYSSRPINITVELLADGNKIDEATISANEDGVWETTFEGLYKYDGGVEIEYSLNEISVDGYDVSYAMDGDTITISNKISDICEFGGCGGGIPPIDVVTPETGRFTANTDGSVEQPFVIVSVVFGGIVVAWFVIRRLEKRSK